MRLVPSYILTGLLLCASQAVFSAEAAPSKSSERMSQVAKEEQPRIAALREYSIAKGIADGRRAQFQVMKADQLTRKSELDRLYQVDHLYVRPTKTVQRQLESGAVVQKEVEDPAFKGFLIQPPVILTGTDLMQLQQSGKAIDWSQVRLQFATNAQFVTAPIHWETFLINDEDLMRQGPADDPLLRARNDEEQLIMNKYYQIAFDEGKEQARAEVVARVKTLTTIIVGMANYHVLASKNVVKKAQVATGYVPVDGNKTQLTLSTFNARVTQDAEFNLNPETYKAIVNSTQ